MNILHGRRSSPWSGYVAPVLENPRLSVLVNAVVSRLRVEAGRCCGVNVRLGGRTRIIEAGTEVIVCAGAIDSPKLLMLSGIGWAEDLHSLGMNVVHDLPGVGRNLQDHIVLGGICRAASRPMAPFRHNLEGSEILAKSRPALAVPDLKFVALQIPFATPEIAAEYATPTNGFCIAPGLVGVHSRGYLRLLSSSGRLEIQPNMLADGRDLEALIRAVEIGFELANQPGFVAISDKLATPPARLSRAEKIEFIRKSALSYAHPVGTCAMGQGPESVVDNDLRLHGIAGLRVADASIMPSITSANTNAPTVMIGEVAAARILRAANSSTARPQ